MRSSAATTSCSGSSCTASASITRSLASVLASSSSRSCCSTVRRATSASASLRAVTSRLISMTPEQGSLDAPVVGPPGRDDDPPAVPVVCSTSPSHCPSLRQPSLDDVQRLGESGLQQVVHDGTDRPLPRVAVRRLGAAVPVGDPAVLVRDDHRIVRQVEHRRLLLDDLLGLLPFGDVDQRGDAVFDDCGECRGPECPRPRPE